MRYLLAALLALLPAIAQAQAMDGGFARPPDVPAYVEKFNGYASGVLENIVGDGSTARGGTMPVLSTMPADIPSTATGWVNTTTGDFVTITNPAAEEAKFRTVGDFSHAAYNDPIRNYGKPGTSHLHCFFGNTQTNAFSTYAGLRTRANARSAASKAASTVAGGPYNATGYWHPCVIKPNAFGDGKSYVVKPTVYIIYYVQNPATRALSEQRIPRGMRYVFGTNMDDPYDTIVKAQIATANAQTGTAGRYAYLGNGFIGYACHATNGGAAIPTALGGDYTPGFKTAAGGDPWAGACTAGMFISMNFNGPNCYDGTNIWSPGGYKHFRNYITDNTSSRGDKGCPNGWFQLPAITIVAWLKHQGYADYGTWILSSDAMANAKAQLIAPGTPDGPPGWSNHTDWMGGWNDATLTTWLDFCFGVSGGTMHTCANSTIDATHKLMGGEGGVAPDNSRNPQVDTVTAYSTLVRSDMVQVPASIVGPHTIMAH